MGRKRKKSQKMGARGVVFLWIFLVWLVVSHPWLLLFPIAVWFCFICLRRPKTVHHRPPSKVIPSPASPPDFIPKDRGYNRFLARTWDEEFEALVKKREQV